MHKNGFKVVGFSENDLYTGMLENSSEFFTETMDIWDRDENILLTSKSVSGFLVSIVSFFSVFLIIQSW